MPTSHDVIITGRGALALFAARKARQVGFSPLIVGTGRPFERFLLLHENALRALENVLGMAPGHPLRGVRVLDAGLREVRRLDFQRAGLRLHAMRYSALLALLEEGDTADIVEAGMDCIDPAGRVVLTDGRELSAPMVVNTVAGLAPRRRLRVRHRKTFRMGFIDRAPDDTWAVQINDAGTYAIIIPFGDDAAVVSSGNAAPLQGLLGASADGLAFRQLRLESWCGWRIRQGRILHVGEALRRVHPHTAQGLNRALDTVATIFDGGSLWRERMHDCLIWAGGILLDGIWGGPSSALVRTSLALLATAPGLCLASGILLQRRPNRRAP